VHRTASLIAVALAIALYSAPVAGAEFAAPASEGPVTVVNEATGDECGTVTVTGGVAGGTCPIHLISTDIQLLHHTLFGEIVSAANCQGELEGAIDASGSGTFGYNQLTFPPYGSCRGTHPMEPCTPAEADSIFGSGSGRENWPFRIVEDQTNGSRWMEIDMCVGYYSVFIGPLSFHGWAPLTGHSHPAGMTMDHRPTHGTGATTDFEVTATWSFDTSTHSAIEIVH